MSLEVSAVNRKFIIEKDKKADNIELADPHPGMSLQEVVAHYSNQYPELTTANVEGPIMDGDTAIFKFTTVLGAKG